MTPYCDIPTIESNVRIEDYIQALSLFSVEVAGKMKYALESAKKQSFDEGYHDGYRDGNVGPAGDDPAPADPEDYLPF